MRRPFFLFLLVLLFCSHDLFLKMEQYFLPPNHEASMSLYNGTFEKSENIITRDRMLDASLIFSGKRVAIDPEQWVDQDSTITRLPFTTGAAGTYVAGVSTKPRNIELSAEKFNNYLKHDGVLDMLAQRAKDSVLDQDAVESYEKHVKAIYQVGNLKTNDWSTPMGYPIEFVPKANPYEKYSGEQLEVQLLLDGQPLSNQLVYADVVPLGDGHSHKHSGNDHHHGDENNSHGHFHKDDGIGHKHDDAGHNHADDNHGHSHEGDGNTHSHNEDSKEPHTHTNGQQLRTNEQGMVIVDLPKDGIYYLRTIYMTKVTDSEDWTHRSKWATLTFGVTHNHGADSHTHDHDHDHEDGIPTWMFVLGSALLIGLLFFVFRKKK